jgi:hypothetical protein
LRVLPSVARPGGRKSSAPARLRPLPVVSVQIVGTTVRMLLIELPDRFSVIVLPPEVLPL